MKNLIVGGIYQLGYVPEHSEYYVVVGQNQYKVLLFNADLLLSNGINTNNGVVERIEKTLKERKIVAGNFFDISIEDFEKYNYIHGYLGEVEPSILESLNAIAWETYNWIEWRSYYGKAS